MIQACKNAIAKRFSCIFCMAFVRVLEQIKYYNLRGIEMDLKEIIDSNFRGNIYIVQNGKEEYSLTIH